MENDVALIHEWEHFVKTQLALRTDLDRRKKLAEKALTKSKEDEENYEEARDLLISAVAATQDQVRMFIEETVTLALQSVFGPDYSFSLEMKSKRGQSEMEPVIFWNDERFSPRTDVGGGIVDVASFALRLVLWALAPERSAPVLLLDEPFKFLSKDHTAAASSMLKGLAEMLSIQVLMVSHDTGLIDAADKAWEIRRNSDGVAEVTELIGVAQK